MNKHQREREQAMMQLQQLGLVASSAIDADLTPNDDDTPWYLQLLFGMSGVLASLFFIGFLTLVLNQIGISDSPLALFVIGVLLSGAALALFGHQTLRHSPFALSLTFAIGVAGQLYMSFALFSSDISEPLSVWLFLLLQIIMTAIMPNLIYRLLSSVTAQACVVYLLSFYHVPELALGLLALITAVATLQRYTLLSYLPKASQKWQNALLEINKAVGYASAFMLLTVSVFVIASEYGHVVHGYGGHFYYDYYLAQGLLILACLYAAYLILQRYHVRLLSMTGLLIMSAIIAVGAISVYVSGLLATSLVIVIAVANTQRVLLGLGVLALVSYIFWYYYQLDTSLLVKSASMLIVGAALLVMRQLLVHYATNQRLTHPKHKGGKK